MSDLRRKTFLIESYVPQLDEDIAATLAARLRAAVTQLQEVGAAVEWLGSLSLVGEETYIYVLGAPDAEHVARLNRRAGIESDHVVEVLATDVSLPME